MIEILNASPHVAAFRFQGTLDGDDYDRCIELIETRLDAHDRIALFCDLRGMEGITPAAVAKDLHYAIGKLGEYRRFARGAVVTERDWLARVTGFAAAFFPRTEIRTFTPAEYDAALAWASEPLPAA